ncbi:MAG: hypothetical protein ACXW4U_04485 [Anaerolineales bacterium]
MNVGAMVEVAIGLIFVWVVLSLTTIQIQEWINTLLDRRAKDMQDAIHEMLANPNLKSQFYDHPVIRSLTAKKRKIPSIIPRRFYNYPIVRGFTQEKREIPSYIPSQQFALSLFDIAMTAGAESSLIQQGIYKIRDDLEKDKKNKTREQAAIDALNILADLARSAAATEAGTSITKNSLELLKTEAEKFSSKYPQHKDKIEAALGEANRLKGEIEQLLKKQKSDKKADPALIKLRQGVAALSVISPELNQTLSALLLNLEDYLTAGETHLAKARKNVESWFNDSMDQVSGAFKRYSQGLALLIGFGIALLLNIDSINLTLYLWREPSVRQVLATKAEQFDLAVSTDQTNPYEAMQDFREQFTGLNLPIGWTFKDHDDPIFNGLGCAWFPTDNKYFGVPLYKIPGINQLTIYEFELKNKCLSPSQPDRSTNLILKLSGIFLTALAARQGAPFWFDLLKRLVNLRGSSVNPDEKAGK